jgi:hypothetical protein
MSNGSVSAVALVAFRITVASIPLPSRVTSRALSSTSIERGAARSRSRAESSTSAVWYVIDVSPLVEGDVGLDDTT